MTAAGIDGGLYTDITSFARDTRWLNSAMNVFTTVSLAAIGVLLVAAWWLARRGSAGGPGADTESTAQSSAATATPRLLAVVVGVAAAIVVNEALKVLFDERRPCLTIPHSYTVVACPGPTDYSFPSNHAAFAGALAAGVYLLHRRLGLIAAVLALLEGFSRIYLGQHYPHDVVVGLLVGAVVTALVAGAILRLDRGMRISERARAAWTARAPQ